MDSVADVLVPIPSKTPEQAQLEDLSVDESKSPEKERKVTFDIPSHHPTRPNGVEEQDFESRLDQFVTEESESKWRCKLPDCTKLFKGHHFWRRHAFIRHTEFVAELKVQKPAHVDEGIKPELRAQVATEVQVETDLASQANPESLDNESRIDDKDETSSCGSWQPLVKPSDEDVRVLDDDDDDSEESEHGRSFRRNRAADWDDFFEAAKKGDVETLQAKLEKGCKANVKNVMKYTPLVTAIMEQQVDAVKLLLEHDADANERVNTLPPLCHAACQPKKETEMMELLIEHGAILSAISVAAKKNALHWAVSEGRNDAVVFLLDKKMDIEKKCLQGRTPLLLTAEKGHKETAELLLERGADIAVKSENGGGALMWAACHGQSDMIDFWLDKGLDVDATDNYGNTALHLACQFGYPKVVEKLIERGANQTISTNTPSKWTPLMAAAGGNHPKVIEILLKNGCDPISKNGAGFTALEIALTERKTEAIQVMLEAMDPSCPKESVGLQIAMSHTLEMMQSLISVTALMYSHINSKDETPGEFAWLEWVIKQGGEPIKPRVLVNLMHTALEGEKVDMVKALVSQGCDVNVKLESGHSPLSWACHIRNIDLIKALLDLGADPNQPIDWCPTDQTPFDSAVICMKDGHDTEIVDLLLATGRCKINTGRDISSTPFSFVLSMSKVWEFGLAEILGIRMLDSIKDVNDDRDAVGNTLLHTAIFRESEEFVELLIKKGADIEIKNNHDATPFMVACPRSLKMMEIMIKHGCDVKTKYKVNNTGLMAAAICGRLECIEKAVDLGIDLEEVNDGGMPALGLALDRRYEEEALYLIKKGANIHWKTKDGVSALHLAARNRMYRIVPLLLKSPLDINARCSESWTPLHEAAAVGATPMVINLLEAGADIEAEIANSDRALHLALINRHSLTARTLIERGASITARGDKNRNPLHLAAVHGHPAIVTRLLDAGQGTEDTDAESWTPLCCCSNLETLKILIAGGANVNYADRDGWTPLHQAVAAGEDDCAEALLEAGADVRCRTTDDGLNVLERAQGLKDKIVAERMMNVLFWGTRERAVGSRLARRGGFVGEEGMVFYQYEFEEVGCGSVVGEVEEDEEGDEENKEDEDVERVAREEKVVLAKAEQENETAVKEAGGEVEIPDNSTTPAPETDEVMRKEEGEKEEKKVKVKEPETNPDATPETNNDDEHH